MATNDNSEFVKGTIAYVPESTGNPTDIVLSIKIGGLKYGARYPQETTNEELLETLRATLEHIDRNPWATAREPEYVEQALSHE